MDLAECQLDDIKEATDYLVKKFTKAVEDMEFDQKMGAKVTIWPITHEPKKRPTQGEPESGDPMEATDI